MVLAACFSSVLSFIYTPPPSIFISAMSIISFASLKNAGFMEIKGKHMQYSKFWKVGSSQKSGGGGGEKNIKVVSSRIGMLICYTPAFLAGVASLVFLPDQGFRFGFIRWALTIHFCKRILEVLFVHKFSGSMDVDAAIGIPLSYFSLTATMIYAQHLTNGFPEPTIDLKPVGILLFFIGILGNFYHHYLLSRLRSKGKKEYRIPQGGLFGLVICPHYLFEIIDFFGMAFISQTFYAFSVAFGIMMYLMGRRSIATRRWYQSKFHDFPKNTKALIPYFF